MTSMIQNIIKALDNVLEEFYNEYDEIATVLYLDCILMVDIIKALLLKHRDVD